MRLFLLLVLLLLNIFALNHALFLGGWRCLSVYALRECGCCECVCRCVGLFELLSFVHLSLSLLFSLDATCFGLLTSFTLFMSDECYNADLQNPQHR